MHQVAERAGVSIKTVSNVVNDLPLVRPETRARVEEAIAALGYRVNVSARNLRRGRTGLIGLALPELSLPYFAELADSVMEAASARGTTVLIEQTGAERARELAVLNSDHRLLTDGLLFSPLALGQDDVELLRVPYALVLLGERIFHGPVDHVTMANVDGARAATEHLLARGRRRIAVVGHHPGETVGSAALRVQGYRAALEAAGVPFDERLLGEAQQWHRNTGADAMRALLEDGVRFDAVFGLNDAVALGALHVLHERRVAVPEEVLVVGFDAVQETAYSSPPLSTVDPGREDIARTAVGLLLERVAGADVPPRLVVAPHRVLVRESTTP
ncbi:LacI family DNA-binding transcriptional regulator [Cellulomonas endophytica]|uniref:LacI family DNA-binding transcriptional regulator n=1 Tax=Cellulomonas endophytica TaxID=2494735 RepID=UPI0010132D62|nr:LacI family DNA-binding transcriptional regulator [Cellulomonas endophytica]